MSTDGQYLWAFGYSKQQAYEGDAGGTGRDEGGKAHESNCKGGGGEHHGGEESPRRIVRKKSEKKRKKRE